MTKKDLFSSRHQKQWENHENLMRKWWENHAESKNLGSELGVMKFFEMMRIWWKLWENNKTWWENDEGIQYWLDIDEKVMRTSWENDEKMMTKPWQKKTSFLAGTKNDEKIVRTWWENDEEGMKHPCRNLGSELGVMSFSEYRTPRKSGANVIRALSCAGEHRSVVPRSEGRAGRAKPQKQILLLH